jgi:hypothetical protein
MANFIIVSLLIGGFIGWALFALTVYKFMSARQNEIEILDHITDEIKIIKEEIKQLK